jgi:hypothetical protein
LSGAAEAIYFFDLAPANGAGAVLSHDTKELRRDEISLVRNARLLQFIAAGVDWVPTRGFRGNCSSPPIRAERPNRCRTMSSR